MTTLSTFKKEVEALIKEFFEKKLKVQSTVEDNCLMFEALIDYEAICDLLSLIVALNEGHEVTENEIKEHLGWVNFIISKGSESHNVTFVFGSSLQIIFRKNILVCYQLQGGCGHVGIESEWTQEGPDHLVCPVCKKDFVIHLNKDTYAHFVNNQNRKRATRLLNA